MRVNINRYFAGYFAVCLATLLRPDLQGEAPTPVRLDCQVITSGYESISIYGLWFCFVYILSLCILFSEIAASATLRKCNWKPRSANNVRIPIVFFSWFQISFTNIHPAWESFSQVWGLFQRGYANGTSVWLGVGRNWTHNFDIFRANNVNLSSFNKQQDRRTLTDNNNICRGRVDNGFW